MGTSLGRREKTKRYVKIIFQKSRKKLRFAFSGRAALKIFRGGGWQNKFNVYHINKLGGKGYGIRKYFSYPILTGLGGALIIKKGAQP